MKRYKEKDIPRLKERTIFFDANILLSIYFTINPHDWAQINYSRVFAKLLDLGNKLIFDITVVSEVVNRALRMEHKAFLRKNKIDDGDLTYKDFRNSEDGVLAWRKTRDMMCDVIFPKFNIIEKGWSKEEIEDTLNLQGDFNDLIVINLCNENNYVLLTNDSDFVNANIDVLSLNRAYF